MMQVRDRDMLRDATVVWHGLSGRAYELRPLPFDTFMLAPARNYLVAIGSHVLWTGSGGDLVFSAESRARFRLAMDCADRAYEVVGVNDPETRMTTLWDLENASMDAGRSAA